MLTSPESASVASQEEPVGHQAVLARYSKLVRRRVGLLLLLVLVAVGAFCVDLVTGPSDLSVLDALRGLFMPEALSRSEAVIIWNVRLPYAVMALLVGAALSLAGAEMQTILDNPLASPYTLGVSTAASFGAGLAIVLNMGIPGVPENWVISGNAFLFAFGSVLLLQALAKLRSTDTTTLILLGIALFFAFEALVLFLQFVASEQALQQLVFWTMGSLVRASWDKIQVLGVVLGIVAPFSLAAAWKMTALRLGDERARSFGVNVRRLRFAALLRISILAATAVAFVGTIGFVGLVGPHIARLLIGEDHRFFLPASVLAGGIVMLLSSIASKSLVPGILVPIGIVTSLIGVPVFLTLILRKRSRL